MQMQILKGIKARPRRILIYGVHGCGKSTWASEAPKPFFVNLEDGVNDIDCDKSQQLRTLDEVMYCLHWLLKEPHDYKTCVIDTIDWLEQVINKDLCEKSGAESLAEVGGGFGKGNARAISKWSAIVDILGSLQRQRGMSIILISHAKIEKIKPADQDAYDKYAPDLANHASMVLQEWCDEVLFAQFKVYVAQIEDGIKKTRGRASGGKEVIVRTSETPYAYAKNRVAGMPSEIQLSWPAYFSYVKAHYATIKKGDIESLVVDGSSKVEPISGNMLMTDDVVSYLKG